MLKLHALHAFQDNLIWLLEGPDGTALVVDPGQAAPVLGAVERGLRVAAVLLTHHHPDHAGGVGELAARTGAPVFRPDDPRLDGCGGRAVGEGERLRTAGMEVQVLAVPGHTLSHIAFVVEGHLFCGDTLFSLGCGRLFEGTPAQMMASLERLAALPGATRVCCGHEYTLANGAFARAVEPDNPAREAWLAQARRRLAAGIPSLPSSIEVERAANPFLRLDQPGVQAGLAAHGLPCRGVEGFAALRAWKDRF
ncbi:MAG: hydroxyacylglutathione hydrolase [Lysobacteraceae bacterium]|nr:MAG: hydroxyacylglutathione hydrolase [Xanthomonadaceae bacterium]